MELVVGIGGGGDWFTELGLTPSYKCSRLGIFGEVYREQIMTLKIWLV